MKALSPVAVVVCALLASAATAGAQTIESGSRVALSYSTMQLLGDGSFAMPVGWLVTLGGNVNRAVSGIFEAGANYRPYRMGPLQIYTLQGGVRFAAARHGRVTPFVQGTAGLGLARCCGDISPRLVFEPGGGVDIPLGRRTSVQIAAGLMLVPDEGGTVPLFRVKAGLSVALGRQRSQRR